MAKFKKGMKIRIKPTVSKKGFYAELAGKTGVVEEGPDYYSGGAIKRIRLDSGETLYNVGSTVVEPYDKITAGEKRTFIERKKELQSKIRELQKEIEEIDKKIEYMEENNLNKFDPIEYKIYLTLKKIEEENIDKMQKSKEIAKLIKECVA